MKEKQMYKLLIGILFLLFFISITLLAFQKKHLLKSDSIEKSLDNKTNKLQEIYTYFDEEVSYENKDAGIILSATLTLPLLKKVPPVVILIPGYGKHDRNLSGMGRNSFAIMADYLTKHGIGVLRFDKRGVGKSSGNYEGATTQDFAHDVTAGINYLKSRNDLDKSKIGLIGVSEGGLIASIVAAESKDVSFAILMAPAIQESLDDLVEQIGLQLRADGASDEFINKDRIIRKKIYETIIQATDYNKTEQLLNDIVNDYLDALSESQKIEAAGLPFAFNEAKKDMFIKTFNSPWYHFFLKCNRIKALETVTVPVLVMNGNLDWIASSHKVLPIAYQALTKAGNRDYDIIELSNLNHMFQIAKTGSLAEYATIEEAIAQLALDTITTWILKTVNKKNT